MNPSQICTSGFIQAFKEQQQQQQNQQWKNALWIQVYHQLPDAFVVRYPRSCSNSSENFLLLAQQFGYQSALVVQMHADAYMVQIQKENNQEISERNHHLSLHMYLSLTFFYIKELALFIQQTISTGQELTKNCSLNQRMKSFHL